MDNRKNRNGDISEIMAVVWLAEQGYEVFRNFSCQGPIDVVAVDTNTQKIFLIDVKTARITFTGNKAYAGSVAGRGALTNLQKTLSVKLLYVDPEHNFISFDPAIIRERQKEIIDSDIFS